jgi:hypothetical protein
MNKITKEKLREAGAFHYPKIGLKIAKEHDDSPLTTFETGVEIDDEEFALQGFDFEGDVTKNNEKIMVTLRGGLKGVNHLSENTKRVREVLSDLMNGKDAILDLPQSTKNSDDRSQHLVLDIVTLDWEADFQGFISDPSQSEDYLIFVNGRLWDVKAFNLNIPKGYNSIVSFELTTPVSKLVIRNKEEE